MSRRVPFPVALWVVLNLPAICQPSLPQARTNGDALCSNPC
jgi:hypothetical protein